MSTVSSGGRNSTQKRRDNVRLADKFKGACPPHKVKDLEALVKHLKGDEDKIQERITEWWDEPHAEEPEWEDVNKKNAKRSVRPTSGYRGDKGGASGGGRSGGGGRGYSRGMASGRGGGAERRGPRDHTDKGRRVGGQQQPQSSSPVSFQEPLSGPTPVKNSPPLQGAWGARAAPVTAAPPSLAPVNLVVGLELVDKKELEILPDVGSVTEEDPVSVDSSKVETPFQLKAFVAPPASKCVPTGNVWATKGSAHLIQAEKPKPFAPVPPQQLASPIAQESSVQSQHAIHDSSQSVSDDIDLPPAEASFEMESVLQEAVVPKSPTLPSPPTGLFENDFPASLNGANVNAVGWQPLVDEPIVSEPPVAAEILESSSVGPASVESAPHIDELLPEIEESVISLQLPAPAKVLNMGHWETGDVDESQSLDFGFGSFGHENDVASVDDVSVNNSNGIAPPTQHILVEPTPSASISAAITTNTVSPARPPPGLGLGMPPLPANVVHVHELENKLESVSLSADNEKSKEKSLESSISDKKPATSNLTTATQTSASVSNHLEAVSHHGGMSHNYSGAYTMGGMYNNNYNPSNSTENGFMGVPTPAGSVLAGGVLPYQQKSLMGAGQHGGQSFGQQGGLYGATTSNLSPLENGNDSGTTAGAMTPGIHAAMPYNPAVFYGQQHYQMGQPGGVGYGYGYGAQFGGVQGGFGYQQVMGQGGGYGQPYEDQPQHLGSHNSHHNNSNTHQGGGGGGGGGYSKGTGGGGGGGYRGRSAHHNSHNLYQHQYNPQGHGGYGGQPYNMGYNVDHFNQRGGYGPGNMDPYSMQNSSGYQSGSMSGFLTQDEDQQHQTGKVKSRNTASNPNNMQQFQGPPQLQGGQSQQQSFGLQGGVSENSGASNSGGWSNPSWSGSSWQGS